ncbi:MAG: 7-cyano-7-deazaguanine synthase, partial [Muribaculaceae bacterium]|nr:7-cyano-7-deazaguanine synthase [Muribaculaceae bacterium]
MFKSEKDTLLVLSGGMDSTTMLYESRNPIAAAVNFDYGSNHNMRERHWAREHCHRLGIELIEIDLDFMGKYFESSLLSGSDAIPEGDYNDENMRSTVVPFRNGIMLSIAAGLAESRHLS